MNDGRGRRVRANVERTDNLKLDRISAVQVNGPESSGWAEGLGGFSILLNIALIPTALKRRKCYAGSVKNKKGETIQSPPPKSYRGKRLIN